MRFLEREVYTFAGSRRNAVGPHFFVCGRAAEGDVDSRRWTGRSTCEELAGRAIRKERHAKAREKREKRSFFLFLGGKIGGRLLCPLGGGRDRVAAIAALGYRHRRENGAQLWHRVEHGWKPSLWRPAAAGSSLSSLYTLDAYV